MKAARQTQKSEGLRGSDPEGWESEAQLTVTAGRSTEMNVRPATEAEGWESPHGSE